MNRFRRLFEAIVSSKQAAAKGGARPSSLASRLGKRNERIDVPTSQPSSAYCKASRPLDWAFGSAICRVNSLRCQNLLFPIYRARTCLRAVWVNDPLRFLFLAARKTRAGLRLDCVSGVVRFYLQHSVSLGYRIRSSSPHARAINYAWPTSN
jgi:hypothetical protein